MATLVDNVELTMEESPIYEGAPSPGVAPGTGTAPFRIGNVARNPAVQNLQISPSPSFEQRNDEVRGLPAGVPDLLDTFVPTASFTQRAYLNDLAWWLQFSGFVATIAAGDGIIKDPDNVVIPTGASRLSFVRRPVSTVVAQTMQIRSSYVGEGLFQQANGFAVNQLGMSVTGGLTGSLQGLYVQDTADPNITPSFDSPSIVHLRRRDWLVPTWYSSRGTITDFSWQVTCPLSVDRDPGVQSYFPTKMFYDAPGEATGTMVFADLAKADQDQLMSGGTFAAKHKWLTTTVIGATTYKYSMWIEIPLCQYRGGDVEALANKRRKGGTFNWFGGWDTVSGYDIRFTLVCATTSFGTYI